jgi:transposase
MDASSDDQRHHFGTAMPSGGVHPINLGSHKGAGIRASIEAAGAKLLYLLPYSPDFNPIENAFAKLKAFLRKAAERTIDGLWNKIGEPLAAFSSRMRKLLRRRRIRRNVSGFALASRQNDVRQPFVARK